MAGETQPSGAGAYTDKTLIEWTPDGLEVRTRTREGDQDVLQPLYLAAVAAAPALQNVPSITFEYSEGIATLIERETRTTSAGGDLSSPHPFGEGSIEEVYGVDVQRDLATAPRFADVDDGDIAYVRNLFENGDTVSQADQIAQAWSQHMREYYFLLYHGEDYYNDKTFVFRSTRRAVRYKALAASFANINEVVDTPPVEASSLSQLLGTFPDGQWLKCIPEATHIGNGRYDVTQEWHWALEWSCVYPGGTFGDMTPP